MKHLAAAILALAFLPALATGHEGAPLEDNGSVMVDVEVFDTASTPTLLTSTQITAPVTRAIHITPVSAADFSAPPTDPTVVSITRERDYLVRRIKNAQTPELETEVRGVAVEGTRAFVRMTELDGQPMSGVLTLDIRKIISISSIDTAEVAAEFPDIKQSTFSVPLTEGKNVAQVGDYQVKTKVYRISKPTTSR